MFELEALFARKAHSLTITFVAVRGQTPVFFACDRITTPAALFATHWALSARGVSCKTEASVALAALVGLVATLIASCHHANATYAGGFVQMETSIARITLFDIVTARLAISCQAFPAFASVLIEIKTSRAGIATVNILIASPAIVKCTQCTCACNLIEVVARLTPVAHVS